MEILRQSRYTRKTIDSNGRYNAAKVAALLGWSSADIARYLDRDPSTISRSGSAPAHQDKLAALATVIEEVLALMNGDLPAVIAWFRTPSRVLDWTSPRDLILEGNLSRVRSLVSEVHSGFSV